MLAVTDAGLEAAVGIVCVFALVVFLVVMFREQLREVIPRMSSAIVKGAGMEVGLNVNAPPTPPAEVVEGGEERDDEDLIGVGGSDELEASTTSEIDDEDEDAKLESAEEIRNTRLRVALAAKDEPRVELGDESKAWVCPRGVERSSSRATSLGRAGGRWPSSTRSWRPSGCSRTSRASHRPQRRVKARRSAR